MRSPWPTLLALLLAACSGGSGGVPEDARFAGDYLGCGVVAQTGEPSARADVRRVQADGRGSYEVDFEPDARFDLRLPYTLSADGALNGLAGIVSGEGPLFLEGDLQPGDETHGFVLGVRLDRETGQALLNGDYLACSMSFETATGAVSTKLSGIGADGVQTLDSEILVHSAGATGAESRLFSVFEGYLVVEGGDVGGVTADGALFALADQNGVAGATSFSVAIRKSSAADNALLSGSYVGFGFVVAEDAVVTRRAVIEGDGAGRIRITEVGSDGVEDFRVGGYTVAAEGALGFDDGRTGVVREDGGVFALVDADASDGAIAIWVCARRG